MSTNEDLLFVELALKRELVTQDQIDEILGVQKKLEEMGLSEPIDALMVKKGVMEEEDARAVKTKISPKGGRQQIVGYRLLERLGRGGMGSVYKATQLSLGRPVAIKVLKPSLTRDDQSTARLRREAQLVAKLRHPNIVQGLDFGVSNGFHYFAMEYVEGTSVKDMLEKGPLKEKAALRIVTEVAKALDHAHREGVVHRDVKPGNILIAKDGAVMLADYGLAKGPIEDLELTKDGVTVGTPQYIAPEQAKDPSDVDIRTDVYSLGATLYHMVTGRCPYEGETLAHLIQQVLYEPYAPPRSLRRDLSPEVAFLIEKMMARRPRHRYQSPKELLRDLEAIAKGKSIVPSGWQGDFEAFHLRRRYRRLLAAAVGVFLLGAAVSVGIVLHTKRLDRIATADRALREANALRHVAVTSGGLDSHIRKLESVMEEYEGTKGAEIAREQLREWRAERDALVESQEEWKRIEELKRREEFAKALRRAQELEGKLSGKHQSLAKQETQNRIASVIDARRLHTPKALAGKREALRDRKPEEALAEYRRWLDDYEGRAYRPHESRAPLREGRQLVRYLETAIEGTRKFVAPPRSRLESDDADRDYGDILDDLERRRKQFGLAQNLQDALDRLESPWAQDLRGRFDDVERAVFDANADERSEVLAEVEVMESQGRLADAVEAVDGLASRSVSGIARELEDLEREILAELSQRRDAAKTAWAGFVPKLLEQVVQREWFAANLEISALEEVVNSYRPSPYEAVVMGARETVERALSIETAFLDRIDGRRQVVGGIRRRDGVTEFQVFDVVVDERTIRFSRTPGGETRAELPVEDVELGYLVEASGLPLSDEHVKLAVALIRLAEARRAYETERLSAAEFLRELPAIDTQIALARGLPNAGEFALELLDFLRRLQEKLETERSGLEQTVVIRANKALNAIDREDWQEAHEILDELLRDPVFRETDWVKKNRRFLEDRLEEVKEKLPAVKVGKHFRAPAHHLAGHSPGSGHYRMRLFFDFEDEDELSRWILPEGRVGLIEVERDVAAPVPGGNEERKTRTVHLLGFLPPEEVPDDYLNRHPVRLPSPFSYSKEMAIEFQARWNSPLALLVSLCGTNVVVLSDDGRMESGRGVHIWQSVDLSRPDRDIPDALRKTYLERNPQALAGEAKHKRYFQFEANRWYRVRFEKGEKEARLLVDGRLVLSERIEPYGAKGEEIRVISWTEAELDEVWVEGTLDPGWYRRMK